MKALFPLFAAVFLACSVFPQATASRAPSPVLRVTVADENGEAVNQAHVSLIVEGKKTAVQADTDALGKVRLAGVTPGSYQLNVRKTGFYELRKTVQLPAITNVEVELHHVEEFHETVEVSDSPPEINPAKTESSDTLTNREIFSLPYPSSRDFRNVLPFLPSVVQDAGGEVHIAGGGASENFEQLDGFDITHPVTGALAFRISPDAIRTINVLTSRYSAEFGKGTGGVLRLEGKTGDDQFRFSATNFVPGFELRQGLTPSNVTPRVNLSGPIARGKAWWFEGIGAEYDFNINKDLPFRPNSMPVWRVSSLTRAQVAISSGNVLTADLLVNRERADRVGLGVRTPVGSTTEQSQTSYFGGVKDSIAISARSLLDIGIGLVAFNNESLPKGDLPYVLAPQGVSGTYFETTHSRSNRYQVFTRYVRTTASHRHEIMLGGDIEGITFKENFHRNPIFIVRQDGTLLGETNFTPFADFTRRNTELSLYAQDRWSVTKKLLLEYGLRGDRDDILGSWTPQPRIASTYMLGDDGRTKCSAGIGLVSDRTNLNLITQPLQGQRTDQDFAADGVTPTGPPRPIAFLSDLRNLRVPQVLNWSIGFERMLPYEIYFKTEYQQKRGDGGFDLVNISPTVGSAGNYLLQSGKKTKYDSIGFTAQKKFGNNHEIFASYVRSSARSNAVVPFTFASPLFGQQSAGPLPWDAPNHVVSWGFLPLSSKYDFAYSLDWRTGFPILLVNQEQQAVLSADRARFPDYFTLNLHIERRFHFHGHEWAVRVGLNNVTDSKNPIAVDNNIDSPTFLTFSQNQHRNVTARIRLVGRK